MIFREQKLTTIREYRCNDCKEICIIEFIYNEKLYENRLLKFQIDDRYGYGQIMTCINCLEKDDKKNCNFCECKNKNDCYRCEHPELNDNWNYKCKCDRRGQCLCNE